MQPEEIENRMTYHKPSEAGAGRHARLSAVFAEAMRVVAEECPPGREQSVAMTHIETAKMWASAGVARNPRTC